jgi:hypothetical protein
MGAYSYNDCRMRETVLGDCGISAKRFDYGIGRIGAAPGAV